MSAIENITLAVCIILMLVYTVFLLRMFYLLAFRVWHDLRSNGQSPRGFPISTSAESGVGNSDTK